MAPASFVDVQLEPCEIAPEGLSLRWKAASAPRTLARVCYRSEMGLAGWWRVAALDASATASPARAVAVEDSSEGTSLLVVGGSQGLLLEHLESGARERLPYLLLALETPCK